MVWIIRSITANYLIFMPSNKEHFQKKEAIAHVIEKRAEGILSLSESHGTEMPGHLSAAADAARESALLLLLLWWLLFALKAPVATMNALLIAFGLGLLAWKTGRSAWLGWARLERLHRVILQEKEEIDTHRDQEREELTALYSAKGLSGKLLDDVIDVLMADDDRLLKVMLEEELGLTLQAYEHPLKQCVGASVGVISTLLLSAFFYLLLPSYGMFISTLLMLGMGTVVSSVYEKNRVIASLIWNVAIAVVAFGVTYFIFDQL